MKSLPNFDKLTPEQQKVVIHKQERADERAKLVALLIDPDIDNQQRVFNSLRDMQSDYCEHGYNVWRFCNECEDIDRVLYPELFDQVSGMRLESIEYHNQGEFKMENDK
jgi:hypothetical protein